MSGIGIDIEDPVDSLDFDRTLAHVQQTLDLLSVVEAYGAATSERSDGHVKMACVLPSLEPGCESMTCAEQDASTNGGMKPESAKLFPTDIDGYWRWHCYSCKRGGDVVDYIAHAEGWPLNDQRNTSLKALRRAAQLAGATYLLDGRKRVEGIDDPQPELITTVEPGEVRAKPPAKVDPDLAFGLNQHVAGVWYANLQASAEALAYVRDRRGVTDEQIARYGLGYARQSWDDLRKRINTQHHPLAVRLGLLKMSKVGKLIDMQRHRLIFPYMQPTPSGFVVAGFAGRILPSDDPRPGGKFMNSLNVAGVWEKRSQLFGMWQARERACALDCVVVCEGPADALAFDRLGIPAVALVGVAMTVAHARAIARDLGARRVTLALDGDEAGRRPIPTCIAALVEAGFAVDDIGVINCDDGQDPDEMDPERLRARYEAPTPAVDYLRALNLDVPEPPPELTPEICGLQQRETELVEAVRANVLGKWERHEQFKAWLDRDRGLRTELAEVRKQLAAAS